MGKNHYTTTYSRLVTYMYIIMQYTELKNKLQNKKEKNLQPLSNPRLSWKL